MNLGQISYFVKAAETLNFSRAAEELYVTQQAVSKAVANLEEELGCRLFERGASGLALTPAGRHAYDDASTVLRGVDRLMHQARTGGGRDASGDPAAIGRHRETVRLAVADVILGDRYYVPLGKVLRFSQENPSYELDIRESTSDACLAMLEAGDADVAVVAGCPRRAGLLVRKLHEESAALFVGPGHPLAKRRRVGLDELANETFLIPRGSSDSADEICEAFYRARADVPDRSQFLFPECTPGLLVERVCRGEGVGVIGMNAVGFIREARGVVLATTPNPFVMRLTVAVRRPLAPGSGADLLRNHLLELFADEKE